jgi:hypothetical protein
MADRRHREIARRIRNFEVGEDRAGEAAILAMLAQRALGFAGGATGVVQRRDVVDTGEAARRDRAHRNHRGQKIDAVAGGAECEQAAQIGGPGGKLAAAIAERIGIDHQHPRFGILDLKQLILKRAQRMQPGDREPRQLRGDTRAPGVGAVGGQERHPRTRLQGKLDKGLLDAADQFGDAAIGQRSAGPTERGPLGIARQRPQRLLADGRKGMKGIGHASSK